ncbi:MAG: hypothetical protein WD894_16705 [Pirellulales bacterium]
MLKQWPYALIAVTAAFLAGCGESANRTAPNTQQNAEQSDGDHAHKPGAHGGNIVAIGRDAYHAEAVFEKGGGIKFYLLGQDESAVLEVEKQSLVAHVKVEGESESVQTSLDADPQPGDSAGKTSAFAGKLPEGMTGKPVTITIPSLKIGADRYRIAFSSAVEEHSSDEMPVKVADDDEQSLYLTSGGKYTEADIKANGSMTASEKFKGFRAAHDLSPKSGDRICPVTLTKANEKCSWIVGGKTYEFCCPPCVDEFVKMAKENPADLKEPDQYVKK